MDIQSPDSLSKNQCNMLQETKDTIANTITIMGTGSVVIGVSEWLTLILLVTGIVFNVVRLIEIKKRKKE